jgi:hypothetical protein
MFAPSREFSFKIVSNCFFSGQQRLQDIRGGTSVPRIVSFRANSAFKIFEVGLRSLELFLFGPAAPSRYSRRDFDPLNCFFRASSAFKIFEAGLRSLELFLLGQQRLQDIRGGASIPRIVFWVSSTFKLFEARLRSFELPFSAQ